MRRGVAGLLVVAAVVGGGAAVVHGSLTSRSDQSGEQQRALRGDANLLVASDIAAPTGASGAPTWSQYALDSEPTLVCQGTWLTNLGQSTLIFRKYDTGTRHGVAAPAVREAVLEFDSVASAIKGYQTATGWLESCPATLATPAARATGPLRTPTAPIPTSARSFAGLHQRAMTGGSAYDDFVGRSGTRLLVFEYSQAASGDIRPFTATLAKAAIRAAQ